MGLILKYGGKLLIFQSRGCKTRLLGFKDAILGVPQFAIDLNILVEFQFEISWVVLTE